MNWTTEFLFNFFSLAPFFSRWVWLELFYWAFECWWNCGANQWGQPPPILATDGGLKLAILQRNVGQKWLGCMLAAERSQSQHIDLEYHLQQASKSFYANRSILLNRTFPFPNAWNISMPWSHHSWLLCMFIVELDWNAAWNEIFPLWNERTKNFVANARVNTWSYITCRNYWNLAKHVASLPAHPWLQRLLSWHPFGTRRVGRPQNNWDSTLDAYCRYTNLECWRDAALDTTLWNFFFFSPRSFLAAEGPLTQGCCTGQPPGTDCFYTGQSPDVLVVGKV